MIRLVRGMVTVLLLVLVFVISSVSDPLPVSVSITSPANGSTFKVGQAVTFSASGTPAASQAGCPAASYSWTGDDGLAGSGPSLTKSYSTAGSKSATVTYTQYQAIVGCHSHVVDATVTITVESERLNQILGLKFQDLNANGQQDSGEPGLSGWKITLSGPVSGIAFSNAFGNFQFNHLPDGTYTVCEELQTGWQQSSPTVGPACPGGTKGHSVTLSGGQTVDDLKFGNLRQPQNEIHGRKFHDRNANGRRDDEESGLDGWLITLTGFDSSGKPIARRTVTENGEYWFMNLPDGRYTICEQNSGRPQDQQTLPGRGPDCPGATHGYQVTVSGGQKVEGLDFGNYQFAEIHGRKFVDLNGDGLPEAGESCAEAPVSDKHGCVGVKVQLMGTDSMGNSVSLETTTNDEGVFWFMQLVPGSYTVTAEEPAGFACSFPSQTCSYAFNLVSGDLQIATFGGRLGGAPGPRFPNVDLTLEATGSPPSPTTKVGESFTLDFSVMNRGPDDAPEAIFEGDMTLAQGSDFVSGKVMTAQGESSCSYQGTSRLIDCQFALKAQERGQVELVLTNNGKEASNFFESRLGLIISSAVPAVVVSLPAVSKTYFLARLASYWVFCLLFTCPPPAPAPDIEVTAVDNPPPKKILVGNTGPILFLIKNKGTADTTAPGVVILGNLSCPNSTCKITQIQELQAQKGLTCSGIGSTSYACQLLGKLTASKFDSVLLQIIVEVDGAETNGELTANVKVSGDTNPSKLQKSAIGIFTAELPEADLSVDVSFTVDGKSQQLPPEAVAGDSSVDLHVQISRGALPPLGLLPTDKANLDIIVENNGNLSLSGLPKPPAGCDPPIGPNIKLLFIMHCSFSGWDQNNIKLTKSVDLALGTVGVTDLSLLAPLTATAKVSWDSSVKDVKDTTSADDSNSATLKVRRFMADLAVEAPGPPSVANKQMDTDFIVQVINNGPLDATNAELTIQVDGRKQGQADYPADLTPNNVSWGQPTVTPSSNAISCQPSSPSPGSAFTLVCSINKLTYDLKTHMGETQDVHIYLPNLDCGPIDPQALDQFHCGRIKVTASVASGTFPNNNIIQDVDTSNNKTDFAILIECNKNNQKC